MTLGVVFSLHTHTQIYAYTNNIIIIFSSLTWESFNPSFSANFLRSGLLIYFCIWKRFSSPWRCASEKTARLIIPRLGLPRAAHGKPAANGNPANGLNVDDDDPLLADVVSPFVDCTLLWLDAARLFDVVLETVFNIGGWPGTEVTDVVVLLFVAVQLRKRKKLCWYIIKA